MELSEALRSRRSVHEYTDESLDEETIRAIFEDATFAPSSFNLQPWEYLVLTDDGDRQRLRAVANDQEHVTEAPAAVVVLGNTDPSAHAERVFEDWLDKEYIPNEDVKEALVETADGMAEMEESERRVWTTRSTALGAMAVMLSAWDRGVASCPMEGFDAAGLVEEFGVPEGFEPVMLLTMGYPVEDAADLENERKLRRPVDEIVHFGSFDGVEEPVEAPADD
jgi:nitroreductase